MKALKVITAVLLLVALMNMPIGYYTFLRIEVFIAAILVILFEIKNGINYKVILFGIVAVLFNPIIPVYLHQKETWMIIDVVTSALFIISAFEINTITNN